MSVKGLVVHLRRDLDDHEAERTIDALLMVKGVTKVSPVAAGYEDDLNRQRVKRELLDKILALLGEELASSSARAPPSSRRSSAAGPSRNPPTCAIGPRICAVVGVELALECCTRQRDAPVLRPWPALCLGRLDAFEHADVRKGAGPACLSACLVARSALSPSEPTPLGGEVCHRCGLDLVAGRQRQDEQPTDRLVNDAGPYLIPKGDGAAQDAGE